MDQIAQLSHSSDDRHVDSDTGNANKYWTRPPPHSKTPEQRTRHQRATLTPPRQLLLQLQDYDDGKDNIDGDDYDDYDTP